MSQYVVSARKYRPQTFEDVVGQQQVTATLRNALKSNHLAQSFLFCGPRGVGKTTCARILAKAINCEQPTADMEPCNACASCLSFNAHTSFNIHELDAASNNSVDDMRSLTDQVRFTPQAGRYKVYIIDEVHMLSQSAFNAFLKTLEEPPPYAVFILATTEKHKIIPTILSRCQIFDFKRIGVRDIADHLRHISRQEGIEADDNALHIIAQKADGALRDALSIFDKISSFSGKRITYEDAIHNLNILDYEYYFRITEHLITEDSSALLLSFHDILSRGFEGDTLMLGLAEHFRNLLMCKDEATLPLLEVSDDIAERYRHQARIVDASFLLNALDLASQCDVGYKMARNKRLHVELTLLKTCFLSSILETGSQAPVQAAKKKQQLSAPSPEVFTDTAGKDPGRKKAGAEAAAPPAATAEIAVGQALSAGFPELGGQQEMPDFKPSADVQEQPTEAAGKGKTALDGTSPKKESPSKEKGKGRPANIMRELQEVISGGEIKLEQKASEDAIPLTQESVNEAWKQFLETQAHDLPPNFISNANQLTPTLQSGTEIRVMTRSSVVRGFITEQGSLIKTWMRGHFRQNGIQFKVEFEVDDSAADTPKPYLNPREQFKEMAKENPNLIDLQKRFDLDIEY